MRAMAVMGLAVAAGEAIVSVASCSGGDEPWEPAQANWRLADIVLTVASFGTMMN